MALNRHGTSHDHVMLDLHKHPDILKSPDLDMKQVTLCGVRYGCPASEFPAERVCQVTLAPIVASMSRSREGVAIYRDAQGGHLSHSAMVENALQCGGILHFIENVSFRFEAGQVAGFAIYGAALDHFRYIQSYARFVEEFGAPDVVSPQEAYGELMGYEHYYSRSNKFVGWDEMGLRISGISFGMLRYNPQSFKAP